MHQTRHFLRFRFATNIQPFGYYNRWFAVLYHRPNGMTDLLLDANPRFTPAVTQLVSAKIELGDAASLEFAGYFLQSIGTVAALSGFVQLVRGCF